MMNEEFSIPDSLVGLVIGKGGEQIIRLQSESGCKIQIAPDPYSPDSGGLPTRSCTLTGPPESIAMCRSMLNAIVERGRQQQTAPVEQQKLGPGQIVHEINVPGQKAGLVIGKGGETIKRMQEENRVKMVMIQDTNQPTVHDKPLRITGSEADVAAAKDQIMALLASKDMEPPSRGGRGFGDYGGPPRGMDAGFNSFGEFNQGPSGHQKGPQTSVEMAVPGHLVGVVIGKGGDMINKIQTESTARIQFKKDDEPGLPERLCAISGTPQSVQHAQSMIHSLVSEALQGGRGGGMRQGNCEDETHYPVPNEKCGFVIGKGGDNIKQINQTTGAYVEISKDAPPNATEKFFKIKGSPDQIRHAIRMICERAGLVSEETAPAGPPGPGGPPPGPAAWGGAQTTGGQGYGGGQQQWASQQYDNKAASFGSMDNSWSMYGAGASQPSMGAGASGVGQPSAGAHPTSMAQPATLDPLTGQPDYTQAWAEYFRQQGMTDYANAILSQQPGAPAQSTPQPAAAPAAAQQAVSGYQFAGMNTAAAMPFPAAATLQGYGQSFQPTAAAGYQQSAYTPQ